MTTAQQVAYRVDHIRKELGCGQDHLVRLVAGELGVIEAVAVFKALARRSPTLVIKDELGERRLRLDKSTDKFAEFYAQIVNRELRDIEISDQLSKSFIIIDGEGVFWIASGSLGFLGECNLDDAELLKYYVDVMSVDDDDEARVMSVWQELERYM